MSTQFVNGGNTDAPACCLICLGPGYDCEDSFSRKLSSEGKQMGLSFIHSTNMY